MVLDFGARAGWGGCAGGELAVNSINEAERQSARSGRKEGGLVNIEAKTIASQYLAYEALP